ncbi:uncharacterized protein LOC135314121 [Phalacrocorax carbo]|uniref:uncharacterized protein LOC135314121 n=3 Tax=Phalacrocorax carbo TaxID=9209 RepID=UPI003119C8E0
MPQPTKGSGSEGTSTDFFCWLEAVSAPMVMLLRVAMANGRPRPGETMITLSLALPLTVALCTLSLLPAGLRIYINPTWLIVESEAPPEDLKQPPVDAESMTTEWDSSIDVQSPYGLVRIMMDAVIEGLRKLPFVGESMVPKRHSSTGPRSPQSWVRLRKDVAPVGPKELPVVAKSVASDPPYPLGQLWDSLAQADRTQLCCRALQSLWLCFLSWVALRLWRNGNRPQGQGKERPASSSVGTDCSEEGTFSSDEAVHQLEAKITPLARCTRLVYRLRLKVFPHQHSEKKAEGEASGGEPSLAPCAPPPRACSRRIGKRRCRGAR